MGRIGLCVFCLLKSSVEMCILLAEKLETVGNITTKSGSLRNSVQKCGKILRGRKDALAPVVSTLRGRAPPPPPPFRRLCGEQQTGGRLHRLLRRNPCDVDGLQLALCIPRRRIDYQLRWLTKAPDNLWNWRSPNEAVCAVRTVHTAPLIRRGDD